MDTKTAPAASSVSESPAITVDFGFLTKVESESGVAVSRCFQCLKCSNGCPISFAMDYHPYEVIRYVHLGAKDKLVNSRTIWICASCQTCLTRCPNEIDIPRLMDYLKEIVCAGEGSISEKNTAVFHQQFLKSVRNHGRVFEGGLMQGYFFRSKAMLNFPEMVTYAKLGRKLMQKGRMRILPKRIKGRAEIKAMFERVSVHE